MANSGIFLPVLTLVGWSTLVLLTILYRRFRAFANGLVSWDDFRYGESAQVPKDVVVSNRNFMNLVEVPLLFYVVSFVYFMSHMSLTCFVPLAWVYAALRVIHSLIHLSYNSVKHRVLVFTSSNAVLVALWLMVFWGLRESLV